MTHEPIERRRSLSKGRPSTGRKPGRPKTNPRADSTTNKGYGSPHQQQRRAWAPLVAQGVTRCAICGERIRPGQRWHLAHADDPAGSPPGTAHARGLYLGPAHSGCNSAVNRRRVRGSTRSRAHLEFFGPEP